MNQQDIITQSIELLNIPNKFDPVTINPFLENNTPFTNTVPICDIMQQNLQSSTDILGGSINTGYFSNIFNYMNNNILYICIGIVMIISGIALYYFYFKNNKFNFFGLNKNNVTELLSNDNDNDNDNNNTKFYSKNKNQLDQLEELKKIKKELENQQTKLINEHNEVLESTHNETDDNEVEQINHKNVQFDNEYQNDIKLDDMHDNMQNDLQTDMQHDIQSKYNNKLTRKNKEYNYNSNNNSNLDKELQCDETDNTAQYNLTANEVANIQKQLEQGVNA